MQIKDGAAYAALEYTKWDREQGKGGKQVIIQPTAIVYTDKTKYRSDVSTTVGRFPYYQLTFAPGYHGIR